MKATVVQGLSFELGTWPFCKNGGTLGSGKNSQSRVPSHVPSNNVTPTRWLWLDTFGSLSVPVWQWETARAGGFWANSSDFGGTGDFARDNFFGIRLSSKGGFTFGGGEFDSYFRREEFAPLQAAKPTARRLGGRDRRCFVGCRRQPVASKGWFWLPDGTGFVWTFEPP